MKKELSVTMFFAIAFLLLCSSANAQQVSLNKRAQEVWNKVVTLNNQIFGTKDSAKIDDFIHPNVEYVHSNGSTENKTVMVHNAINSKTIYNDVSTEFKSIKIYNKVAIVRHVLKAISIQNDVQTPLELGVLQIWKQENGKWKLLERQAVKLNVKK